MPIRKLESKERGASRFFFKGTVRGAQRVSDTAIQRVFRGTGVVPENPGQIRQGVLKAVQWLEEKKQDKTHFWVELKKDHWIPLSVKRISGNRILVYQTPLVHGVRRARTHEGAVVQPFEALQAILKSGFQSRERRRLVNAVVKKRGVQTAYPHEDSTTPITRGDRYNLELTSKKNHPFDEDKNENIFPVRPSLNWPQPSLAWVQEANLSQIKRVIIELKPGATPEEISTKKSFYRQQLAGWPITFVRRRA